MNQDVSGDAIDAELCLLHAEVMENTILLISGDNFYQGAQTDIFSISMERSSLIEG